MLFMCAKESKDAFLNEKIWSIYDNGDTENKHDFGKDIPQSYHLIEKNRPYNNIFELRKQKQNFYSTLCHFQFRIIIS